MQPTTQGGLIRSPGGRRGHRHRPSVTIDGRYPAYVHWWCPLCLVLAIGCKPLPVPRTEPAWLGTYVGGSANDDCDAVATDSAGYVYLACHVTSQYLPGITATPQEPGDPMNAYVAKLDPGLGRVEYGVLLAGSGYDGAFAIAVDERGHAFVTSLTASPDFPATSNALQKNYGGGEADVFLAEIDPTGKPLYVTFLGGSGTDRAFALELEATGSVLLGGATWSADFPGLDPSSANDTDKPDADAFIARLTLSPQRTIRTTVLSGREYEKVTGLAPDGKGNVLASGFTESPDFSTRAALQPELRGNSDGFVAKFAGEDLDLVYSTLIGGSGDDAAWGLDLFADGTPVIGGTTNSLDLPTTKCALQPKNAGGDDAFIARLDAAGSTLEYSSYLGGRGEDSAGYDGSIMEVDRHGRVWLVGQTNSTDFPTIGAPQRVFGGGDRDGFVAILDLQTGLQFSGYIGGEGRDLAEELALGSDGSVWVTGLTSSRKLPFPLALQPTYGGGRFDSFLVRLRPNRRQASANR